MRAGAERDLLPDNGFVDDHRPRPGRAERRDGAALVPGRGQRACRRPAWRSGSRPSSARSFGQEISRSPGTRTNRKSSSARRTTIDLSSARGSMPRAAAASSSERTRPCRTTRYSMPAASSAASARSSLMPPHPTVGREQHVSSFEQMVGRDRADRSLGVRRLPPVRLDGAGRDACASGSRGGRGRPGPGRRHRPAGNLWAWWGDPDADGPGVVIGSHLDSVPEGGAFDGPLGVVSSLAAVEALQHSGFTPRHPIAVACFGDEEGARFGIACAGSRMLTGALDADRARGAARRRRHDDGRGDGRRRARPAARRPGRRDAAPGRHVRRAARRAGPLAWWTSTPPSASAARSGRTAGGASTWPGGPTTPAPRGWRTARTRCSTWRR